MLTLLHTTIELTEEHWRTAVYGLPQWLRGEESVCNVGDAGWIPGVRKIPLEATHSSILAWRIWKIPWTEEPGGLQSIGPQSQTQLKQLSILHHVQSS